ncbi:MAG: hypothetical protein B655_1713 [Methanobacterium sp. Maddingley MBC34]|nr:MAG: hypothetical protein B655_1713 [Methanobacterium sp. Maddingley MBC34]
MVANNLNTSLYKLLLGDQMAVLNEETIKMRYIALVRKGIIDDDECRSYTKKIDFQPCMVKKVQKFEDYFVPGTVLLSDKASYKLRIEYPME